MVPEGWELRKLETVCDVRGGKRLPKGRELTDVATGHPYIRVTDMRNGFIDTSDIRYVPTDVAPSIARYRIAAGDLFISVAGTLGLVGKVPPELHMANLTENADMLTNIICDRDYLLSVLLSDWVQNAIEHVKTTSAQPKLALERIREFTIPLPPLPEQQKIAEILGTWDKAIQTTEALLTNARTQKRALMQSLLTGTRRFPGFEDHPWREVRLGDVLREVNKPVDWSDDELYRLVSVRRRSGGVFHREDLYGHQILTKTLKHAHAGDFLISKMQVVHGAMALVTQEFDGMQISGSYISLVSRDHNKLDIRFFDWLSRTQDMYRRAYQCSYGVHIEKMTFNFGLFLKEMVPMPSSVDEQIMIADALDTAQAEEHWFEVEAERLRTEKKSLMQQLLTGKRRVVV